MVLINTTYQLYKPEPDEIWSESNDEEKDQGETKQSSVLILML